MVFGIVRATFEVPMGRLSDHLGARTVFLEMGLVGSAVTIFRYTQVGTVAGMLGVRMFQGVAPAFALAADIVDERHHAHLLGVVSASFPMGLVVGPILAGALAFLGFAVPFIVAGMLTVFGAIGVWLAADEPQEDREERNVTW